jgi:hypothetical protein
MKKYEPNKLMACPKCGNTRQPTIRYVNIEPGDEHLELACSVCGYYECALPLDANELKEAVV